MLNVKKFVGKYDDIIDRSRFTEWHHKKIRQSVNWRNKNVKILRNVILIEEC